MREFVAIHCPYCGERLDLAVDASAGDQDYIEDCHVCCRPMQLRLRVQDAGDVQVRALHQDEA